MLALIVNHVNGEIDACQDHSFFLLHWKTFTTMIMFVGIVKYILNDYFYQIEE